MGWLSRKIGEWAERKQDEEIRDFVRRLSVMDASEVAMVVALATHVRHGFDQIEGLDLLQPSVVLALRPDAAVLVGSLIRDAQKNKNFHAATGFMVWLHTLRAMTSLDLRQHGRDMWGQLERGFDEVQEARWNFYEAMGSVLLTRDFDVIPDGLNPTPIG